MIPKTYLGSDLIFPVSTIEKWKMTLLVNQIPHFHSSLHVDECLSDVFSKNWDDGNFGVKSHSRESGSLLPHDRVVRGAQLGLVPTPGCDPDEVALSKHFDATLSRSRVASKGLRKL